ncbi:MAG: Trk family potassium uptake protein [Eubacterium sp.]|nr:Trk family potassium uptake protein [Eubacterium sp.]
MNRRLKPFTVIILGFAGVIFLGSCLLTLPVSSAAGVWTSFSTASFTATSAVCVTGLVVRDTGTYWSAFGQTVILIMIQIGGLGVVSMAALLAMAAGKKISLRHRNLLEETISTHQIGGIVRMLRFVICTTFIVELVGALLMMPVFYGKYGAHGIWIACFQSVSAFCNAGMDLMGSKTGPFSSMTSLRGNGYIVTVVTSLIVIGGIGFLTWDDVRNKRHHLRKYRMQSKVALCMTAALILGPAMFLYYTEFAAAPGNERVWLALFQAVTPRTAGFNTADYSTFTGAGKAMTIVLMLIGGCPGSTAGGMKTTTAAVLIANVLSVSRREKHAHMFGRRIEDDVVKTASALMLLYVFATIGGALIICLEEHCHFGSAVFETASAVGTVGLTLGLTPEIGHLSRIVLMVLMFFGRVGGLTLIYAALSDQSTEGDKYPVEKIIVG